MEFRVLALGDVTSEDGTRHLARTLRPFQKVHGVDFTVVNGENVSGVGLTPDQAEDLFAAGADVITLGNHTWGKMQIADYLEDSPYILRPANFSPRTPGRGVGVYDCGRFRIRVISLIGRCDLSWGSDNPFTTADRLLAEPEAPTAPEAPAPAHPESENQQTALVMAHVRRYLEDNYMFDISLDSVGEILHISPAYLSAQFKKYQKMNFLDCLTELRINAAKELLNDPFRSSAEVASMVGYEDASYFARAFKKRTGVTPTQYRKQAAKAAKDQQEAAL
mgnify:CR=1 FL=1